MGENLATKTETAQNNFPVLSHKHISYSRARHHAKVTKKRAEREDEGEDFFDFLHIFYELIHKKIASCKECGRRYQEAYRALL